MKRNIKILSFVFSLLVLIVMTCECVYAYSSELDGAMALVLKGDYYEALDECYRLERKAKKDLKTEILHLQGVCFMKLGDYEQARNVFKKAVPRARGRLSTEVYMGIADSYFMERDYERAINIYGQLLKKKVSRDYLAMLYFKQGKAYQKMSKWAQSKYYFDKLADEFPRSLEAALVKKTSVGGNFFTIQVGCFSSKQNAQKLQDDLTSKGYDVYITPFQSGGRKLYRVRVGEFVSRVAAEHTEKKLKMRESLPTHIFP